MCRDPDFSELSKLSDIGSIGTRPVLAPRPSLQGLPRCSSPGRRALGSAAGFALLGVSLALGSCKEPLHYACGPAEADSDAGESDRRSMRPNALVNGFRTTQFQLARDETTTSFITTLPESDVLTCALFVTNPRFDGSHTRIVNAAAAIARFQVFSIAAMPTLSFTLSSFERPGAETFKACGAPPAIYRVDGLSLGCWAMHGTRLAGASSLLELSPAEVPQAQPAVDYCLRTNLADTAGRLCAVDAQFGVCVEGACETGLPDAAAPQSTNLPACTIETPGEACMVATPTQLGRCRSGRCVQETGAQILADQLVIPCSDPAAATSDARNGYSCPQPELGTFGSCYLGRCRRRCEIDPDCMPSEGSFLGPLGQEVACEEPVANAGVRVCVRNDEVR
jgi:hypothetical protein